MFVESERAEFAQLRPDVAAELADRQAWFTRQGIVRFGPVGYAQAALLDAGRFSRRIADDLRAHVAAHRSLYAPARLEALGATASLH